MTSQQPLQRRPHCCVPQTPDRFSPTRLAAPGLSRQPARVGEMGTRLASVVQTAWQELSAPADREAHPIPPGATREEEGRTTHSALLALSR